jgi:hypothetical protein
MGPPGASWGLMGRASWALPRARPAGAPKWSFSDKDLVGKSRDPGSSQLELRSGPFLRLIL